MEMHESAREFIVQANVVIFGLYLEKQYVSEEDKKDIQTRIDKLKSGMVVIDGKLGWDTTNQGDV